MRSLRLLPLMLLVASLAWAANSEPLKSGVFEPPRMAPEFHLQGSNGAPLKLSDYRGKVVVLEFGYTHCITVCPITLANLASAFRKLGADAAGVQMLYLTVDPERDTVARLHEYLSHFNPSFLGATGTAAEIASVEKEFGITSGKVMSADGDPTHYEMHHSSFIYLIDREGRLRALAPFGKQPDDLAHDLRVLLKQ